MQMRSGAVIDLLKTDDCSLFSRLMSGIRVQDIYLLVTGAFMTFVWGTGVGSVYVLVRAGGPRLS